MCTIIVYVTVNKTVAGHEQNIGAQVRRARLDANIGQQALADRSNISIGALRNLEAGRGATLRTLISVVRGLDLADWLDELYPDPGATPLELARGRGMARRRERASSGAR